MAFIHVPEGLGKLLAQNEAAANAFSMMTTEQKQAVIQRAANAHSRQEMQNILSDLARDSQV